MLKKRGKIERQKWKIEKGKSLMSQHDVQAEGIFLHGTLILLFI